MAWRYMRRLGIDRRTVKKMLSYSAPPLTLVAAARRTMQQTMEDDPA